jgi:hypothetical protein
MRARDVKDEDHGGRRIGDQSKQLRLLGESLLGLPSLIDIDRRAHGRNPGAPLGSRSNGGFLGASIAIRRRDCGG